MFQNRLRRVGGRTKDEAIDRSTGLEKMHDSTHLEEKLKEDITGGA